MRNVMQLMLALCAAELDRFLILSSPKQGLVQYMKLPDGPLVPLLNAGVTTPEGMAVDNNVLYIADLGRGVIHAVDLEVHDGHLIALRPRAEVSSVAANWLAKGDALLFTDQAGNAVYKVEKKKPVLVYDGTAIDAMSNPGALVAEPGSGLVFFGNTQAGTTAGALVAAETSSSLMTKIVSDVESITGICASQNNLFYTSGTNLYGVKRSGTLHTQIAAMLEPRGCAYDQDGTIYVMDRGAGKLYTLPANMDQLAALDVTEFRTVGMNSGVLVYEHDPASQVPKSVWVEGWKEVHAMISEFTG